MSACVLNNAPHKIQSCQGIVDLCTDDFSWTFKNKRERKLYINLNESTGNLNLRKMILSYISIIFLYVT